MDFPANFRRLRQLDIQPLRQRVAQLSEADWQCDTGRQQRFSAHRETQTLALLYDPDFRYAQPTRQPAFDGVAPELEPVLAAIAQDFPAHSYLLRLLLVRLPASCSIASHTDGGASLHFVHRLHLPVITNRDALFTVGDETRHLAAGEVWEINNCRSHSVCNGGASARVHLILDWVTPALARQYLQQQLTLARNLPA